MKGFFALREGAKIPLTLVLTRTEAQDGRRQRLVAFGELAPGAYQGLLIETRAVSSEGEDPKADPQAPGGSIRIDAPFHVGRKRGTVLWLLPGEGAAPFSLVEPPATLAPLLGYVSNTGSNNVTVFDKRSGLAAGLIPTGRGPKGMALDPSAGRLYVALSGESAIQIVDVLSSTVIGKIRLTPGDEPQELALAPGGKTILSVNAGSDTVSFADPSSQTEETRVAVGRRPRSIVLDPTGRRAYVLNELSASISVVDLARRAVAGTIATEPNPLRAQFDRQGTRLYVIHETSPYLLVVVPASLTVADRVNLGMAMTSLKIDPRTGFLYFSSRGDSMLQRCDPFTLVPVPAFEAGGWAGYMTLDGEQNALLALLPHRRSLRIVNLTGGKALSEFDVGESPYQVVVMGER